MLCQLAHEAATAARQFGYPVVLKASAPDLPHKTELGLVRLDLRDEDELRRAYGSSRSTAARAVPGGIEGILVQPYVRGGVETIVGLNDDPLLGWLLVLGLGGTLVEALGAVTWRACPIEPRRRRGDDRRRAGPGNVAARRSRRPPADRAALVEALVGLSRLPDRLGDRLETVDVNPLLVRAEGLGAVALDALVVLKSQE